MNNAEFDIDENIVELEERHLNKWILRLAGKLSMQVTDAITEFMLYTPFKLTLEQWRSLFIYDIQINYHINMLKIALFDEEHYKNDDYLDFRGISAKKQAKCKAETFKWFMSLPADILEKYQVERNLDVFSELLSDDYATDHSLKKPVEPTEFIEAAKRIVFQSFQNIDDKYLQDNGITKTIEDFNKLLSLDLLTLEVLDTPRLQAMTW
ncbi:MAG: hypothetical protein HDS11_02995 [Bacteroides sp.]|nr:hypothetical protein [Bacteroides sp.]